MKTTLLAALLLAATASSPSSCSNRIQFSEGAAVCRHFQAELRGAKNSG